MSQIFFSFWRAYVLSRACVSTCSGSVFGDSISLWAIKRVVKVKFEIESWKAKNTRPHSSTAYAEPNNIIRYNNYSSRTFFILKFSVPCESINLMQMTPFLYPSRF